MILSYLLHEIMTSLDGGLVKICRQMLATVTISDNKSYIFKKLGEFNLSVLLIKLARKAILLLAQHNTQSKIKQSENS